MERYTFDQPASLAGPVDDYLDIVVCTLTEAIDDNEAHFATLLPDAAIQALPEKKELTPTYVVGFSQRGKYPNSYRKPVNAKLGKNMLDVPNQEAEERLYPAYGSPGTTLQVSEGDCGGGLFHPCLENNAGWCLMGISIKSNLNEETTCSNDSYQAMPIAPLIRETYRTC